MLYKAGRCSGSFKIAMTIKGLTGARGIGPADKVIRRSTFLKTSGIHFIASRNPKASGLPPPLHCLTGARGIGPADKVIRRSTLLKASGPPLPLHSLLPQLFANISSLYLSPRINCGKNHYEYKRRGTNCVQMNWDNLVRIDRMF